jgi:thiol-disulfide isomerase/thioredoxin
MRSISFALVCLFILLGSSIADVEIGEAEWEETLANNRQTFVKFYSPYCGWCQKLAPLWTELSNAFDGALNVVSVDVTVHKNLASEQGISGVPTMKLYNGKNFLADYKGPRTQQDMAEWLFDKLKPIKLEYDTSAWSRFTQNSYSEPVRFLYIYPQGDSPNTQKLYDAIKLKGIYAECEIPKDKVNHFLQSYNLDHLPLLTTVTLGGFTVVKNNEIDSVFNELTPKKEGSKRFGDDSSNSDSHAAFTFLFFLIAIIALAIFAWNKLSIPRNTKEAAKSV